MIRVDAQPTPDGELRRQILSKCVEKSEREWWAARTIEKLEFELNGANDRIKRLEEAGDDLICYLSHHVKTDNSDSIWHIASIKWGKAKKAKP